VLVTEETSESKTVQVSSGKAKKPTFEEIPEIPNEKSSNSSESMNTSSKKEFFN
jgi:hypothetical protein